MRIRLAGAACAVLSVLAASACGGGVPSGAGGGTSGGSGGGGGGGGKTVSVAAVWTGEEQDSFQKVLDAFTEKTGIETRFKSTGDDIATYLGSQVAGGNPPDVAILPQPGLLHSLAQQDNLKPLGDAATKNLQQHYADYWIDLASYQGDPYGVYFKASNKSTWWYNVHALQAAGVTPPKTWDAMLDQAKTVVASGRPYVAIGGSDGWVLTDWFENIYLRQAGPKMYDKLTQHKIPWTDPSVTKALKTFGELFDIQGAVMGGQQKTLQMGFTDSVDAVLAKEPQAATVYEGDFVPGTAKATGIKAGQDYAFFDFPSVDGSGTAVVGGGDVAVTLTGSKAGQQLLAFLATPKAAKIWVKRGGFTSPNADVPLSAYPDKLSRRSAEAVIKAADGGSLRFDMSDQTPPAFGGTEGRGLWEDLQNFVRHPDNVKKVQQQLEKDAKAAYGAAK